MKRKVIIDTDPGIDDLLALAVAGALDELNVLAFSTVHGNVSLDYTTRNAALISDLLGLNIPIIKGASKPLFYDKKEVSPVHGEDGLGNLYDTYRKKVPEKTIVYDASKLDEMIMDSDEKITIIALGPLTNIARLIQEHDNLSEKVDEIHIMGGGLSFGNINELAEFNFFSDSHAAKIVFESGIPIVLSNLDLTHKVYFTEEEFNKLPSDNDALAFIKESIAYYIAFDPYMHDVCSVLTLVNPDLFTYKKEAIDIIVDDTKADGLSYVLREGNKNVKVADTKQRTEIIEHIFAALKQKYTK